MSALGLLLAAGVLLFALAMVAGLPFLCWWYMPWPWALVCTLLYAWLLVGSGGISVTRPDRSRP